MIKRTKKFDLIIFGGSFDPPHLGHLQLVEAVQREVQSDRFWIVPAAQPPVSASGIKQVEASFDHRNEMCRLLFGKLSGAVEISDIENELPKPNYSSRTISAAMGRISKSNIALVIGFDQFLAFDSWYHFDYVVANATLIVVRRSSDKVDNFQIACLEKAEAIYRKAEEISENKLPNYKTWLKDKLVLIDEDIVAANSTVIRKSIRDEESVEKGWLSNGVREFINRNQLYK